MPWEKAGTVSINQKASVVTGNGTAFSATSRIGDAFRGPDGAWYEITNISSDTVMSIAPAYQGAAVSAGGYAIAPMQGYVKDGADQLRQIANTLGVKVANLGTTGNYDVLPLTKGGTGATTQADARSALSLTNTDGLPEGGRLYFTGARVLGTLLDGFNAATSAAVTAADSLVAALGKLQAQLSQRALKGVNSDITSLAGLTTALSIAQGGTGQKTAAAGADALGALKRGAANSSAGTQFISGGAPNIATISSSGNDRSGPLQIHNATNNAASAVISFIREGSYGCHLGLDTDNVFKVGGWSMGAVAYKIYHEGNTVRAADGTLRAV